MSERDLPARISNEQSNQVTQLPMHAPLIHSSKSVPSLNSSGTVLFLLILLFEFVFRLAVMMKFVEVILGSLEAAHLTTRIMKKHFSIWRKILSIILYIPTDEICRFLLGFRNSRAGILFILLQLS